MRTCHHLAPSSQLVHTYLSCHMVNVVSSWDSCSVPGSPGPYSKEVSLSMMYYLDGPTLVMNDP